MRAVLGFERRARRRGVANGRGAAVTAILRFGRGEGHHLVSAQELLDPEVQAKAPKRYTSVCVHDLNRFLTGL